MLYLQHRNFYLSKPARVQRESPSMIVGGTFFIDIEP
jgi:hypothetical protein